VKRWVLAVLFSFLLGCPVVWGADGDVPDIGKGTMVDFQVLKFPIGAKPDPNAGKDKNGEEEVKNDQQKQKEIIDKKVDDAIKKAWEEK
jgi:hypothetical protein